MNCDTVVIMYIMTVTFIKYCSNITKYRFNFPSASSDTTRKRKEAPKTVQRPFICEKCGKRYASKYTKVSKAHAANCPVEAMKKDNTCKPPRRNDVAKYFIKFPAPPTDAIVIDD